MKLTSRGVAIFVSGVAIACVAVVSNTTLLWPLSALCLVMPVFGVSLVAATGRASRHDLSFAADRLNAGRPAVLNWAVHRKFAIHTSRVALACSDKVTRRFQINAGVSHAEHTITIQNPVRGWLTAGPVSEVIFDPFATARRTKTCMETARTLVWPRIEELYMPSDLFATTTGTQMSHLRGSGLELHSLREYEQGDDLRRVHWLSSAKRGEPLVANTWEEADARATIIVDTALSAHVLDLTTVAAASLLVAFVTANIPTRLVIYDQTPLLCLALGPQVDAALDMLALAATDNGGSQDLLEEYQATSQVFVVTTAERALRVADSGAIAVGVGKIETTPEIVGGQPPLLFAPAWDKYLDGL